MINFDYINLLKMTMQAKRAQIQLDLLHDDDVRQAIAEGITESRKSILKDAINQMKKRKLDQILALANPTKLAIYKTSQSAIEAGVIHFDQRMKCNNEVVQIIKPILKKAELKIEQESEEYKQEQIYQKIINDHKERMINRGKNKQIENEENHQISQNNLELSNIIEEKNQIIPTIKENMQDSISKNQKMEQKSPEKTIAAQSQSVQQQKVKHQQTSKMNPFLTKTQPQQKIPFGATNSNPFGELQRPKEKNLNSLFGASKPNEVNSFFANKDKQTSTNLFSAAPSSASIFGQTDKVSSIKPFVQPTRNQASLFSASGIPAQKKETSIFSLNVTNMKGKEQPTPERPQQTPINNIFGLPTARSTSISTFDLFGKPKVSQKSDAQAKSIFGPNQDKGASLFSIKPANTTEKTTSNFQNTKPSNNPFNISPTAPNIFDKIERVQKSEAQVKPKEGNMFGLLNQSKEASLFASVPKGKEGLNFEKPKTNLINLSFFQKNDVAPPMKFNCLTGQKGSNLFASKDEVSSSLKFEGSFNKKQ